MIGKNISKNIDSPVIFLSVFIYLLRNKYTFVIMVYPIAYLIRYPSHKQFFTNPSVGSIIQDKGVRAINTIENTVKKQYLSSVLIPMYKPDKPTI